ncbi:Transposon Ty3-I Gag-Pol polyprotein [Vitis vinifera]|uniref:Transposon Ty3-I Gag-Pol polyprotein n=1 Tax=Vitis vinifera TaxID=29760 RepID=A0A438JP18_VITVI|nr:Transposon Ty3-I Gag-Pol polyprotein [Vitis vinifera]
MQEKLNESLGDLKEGLPEPSDLLDTLQGWRRIEEILPLFNKEKTQEAAKKEPPKLNLKPLPTELKYTYLEENKKCPVVISSSLTNPQEEDHFPLPFIDQVLERVSGHPFYCFLDGYSGYFQIEIDVEDQEKTTFTCPFGTYAYRRMPFGLCNAPATFQRCMLSIFSDMVERIMEVFMDDITIYGSTFEECLVNLEAVLEQMH